MEERLEKILLDLNIGYITVKVAKRKILRLFTDSGQSEQLFCVCERNNPYTGQRFDFSLRCLVCNKVIEQNNYIQR
jgi:hypothetical protein